MLAHPQGTCYRPWPTPRRAPSGPHQERSQSLGEQGRDVTVNPIKANKNMTKNPP